MLISSNESINNTTTVNIKCKQKDKNHHAKSVLSKYSCYRISQLFEKYFGYSFSDEESVIHWDKFKEHQLFMCRQLNRKVSIKVAMLDYFYCLGEKVNTPFTIEKNKYEKIIEKYREDDKTGLYNYNFFKRLLEEEIKKNARHFETFSILFIDCDNFKQCNDTYGHLFGDKYLIHLSNIITNNKRIEDVAGRFGGDEFVLLLPYTKKKEAFEMGNRIVQAVQNNPIYDDTVGTYKGTISIGISSFPEDGKTTDKLLECADKALYHAKRSGKNKASKYECNLEKKQTNETQGDQENSFKKMRYWLDDFHRKYEVSIININQKGILIEFPCINPVYNTLYIEFINSKKELCIATATVKSIKRTKINYLVDLQLQVLW